MMQDEDEFSKDALAAHVFYRALQMTPGLIRDWHKGIKDRQTATTIGTIISRHFSPALIESELSVLKSPGALGELEDDTMSIKVPTGAPEISAKYIIDEQPLEIAIRLPSDFPLKAVEVKEVSRFGVTEPKWRGWLLNIQQMIMSRNGLILDALSLFKSNVGLHFEGKTECAIVSANESPKGGPRSRAAAVLLDHLGQRPLAPISKLPDLQKQVPLGLPLQLVQIIQGAIMPDVSIRVPIGWQWR